MALEGGALNFEMKFNHRRLSGGGRIFKAAGIGFLWIVRMCLAP